MTYEHRPARTAGFTRLELIASASVIAILSLAAFVSIETARAKGNDAALKATLNSIAAQASLFYARHGDTYGSYDDGKGLPASCPLPEEEGDTVFHIASIESSLASMLAISPETSAHCIANGSAYAISVSRPDQDDSTHWCVDSAGNRCGVDGAITEASCGACVSAR